MADDDFLANALKKAWNRDPWAVPGKDDKKAEEPTVAYSDFRKLLRQPCPSCGAGELRFGAGVTEVMVRTLNYRMRCHVLLGEGWVHDRGCGYTVKVTP